jgi:two-component sensor histidine kinase
LANVSHELRTPLNAIIGSSDILQDGTFGQLNIQQQQYLNNVLDGGQRLLQLIEGVLDLSRMETGTFDLAYGAVDLGALLKKVEMDFAAAAAHKGLELRVEWVAAVPKAVVTDGQRLQQIFDSLVDNAVKFTERGSVRLSLQGQRHDDATCDLSFVVEDTGIGIPADQQERVFEAFAQKKGQSINEYSGLGFGLAFTRRMAELLGADIRLDSEVGQGSRFEIVLRAVSIASTEDLVGGDVEPTAIEGDEATEETLVLNEGVRERLPELVRLVREDLWSEWEVLRQAMMTTEIELFGDNVCALGRDYGYPPLQGWGEQLELQASMFQVDALPNTLEQLPQIADGLEAILAADASSL